MDQDESGNKSTQVLQVEINHGDCHDDVHTSATQLYTLHSRQVENAKGLLDLFGKPTLNRVSKLKLVSLKIFKSSSVEASHAIGFHCSVVTDCPGQHLLKCFL